MLGSQPCEQAFRSVRSMRGYVGLIETVASFRHLQAQSDDTGIKYPAPAK